MGRKVPERIPKEFGSYEEAAEFWSRHDTTDYPKAFRTVPVHAELRRRCYELEIDLGVAQLLRAQARRRRLTPSQLANHLLRKALADSA